MASLVLHRKALALRAFALAAALAVAACAGSHVRAGAGRPRRRRQSIGGIERRRVAELGSGQQAGLADELSIHRGHRRFRIGPAGPSGTTPSGSGSLRIAGTVINKPAAALSMTVSGAQYILVGGLAWTSVDATSWTPVDPDAVALTDFLPSQYYATWFDAVAPGFKAQGEESRNGIACVHYTADASLRGLYLGTAGTAAGFQADLWVARDGGFPVGGIFGYSTSIGSSGGDFGFSFDISHVNDAANTVVPPTNVVALPS